VVRPALKTAPQAVQLGCEAVINPRIDQLLDQVDGRYSLVIAAAKRARQINNYHQQLGEGTFDDFAPPLIESRSKNYLTMAFEEISEGKLDYSYAKE
jgi:DNA-directed RNA polymerase subunit omega